MLQIKVGSVLLLEMRLGCVERKIECIFVDQHDRVLQWRWLGLFDSRKKQLLEGG